MSSGMFWAPPAQALQTQCQSSGSLSPSQPSKEYVYLGGRLIATEEPGNCTVPPSSTPVITSLSRTPAGSALNVAAPGENFTLTIIGSNLGNANGVSFTPAQGISVTNVAPSADGKKVTVAISLPVSTPTGSYQVAVNINTAPPSTTNALQFFVALPNVPQIFPPLNPSSVPAGGPPVRVTITAGGFNASSVVQVNGINRLPVPGSINVAGGTLQVDLQASEVALPGSIDLSVANPDPGDPSSFLASPSGAFLVTPPKQ